MHLPFVFAWTKNRRTVLRVRGSNRSQIENGSVGRLADHYAGEIEKLGGDVLAVVRHEYWNHIFAGFVQLACLFTILKRF
jgi:hypothetical protein